MPPPPPLVPPLASLPPPPLPPPTPPTAAAGALEGGASSSLLSGVRLKKVEVKKAADKMACPARCKIEGWLNTEHLPPTARTALGADDWLEKLFACHPSAKVALVDFFAYSCTNCVRTIGGLQALHETYGQDGLLIIALHRPEFDFERDRAQLAHFLASAGVTYLVGMDNADAAWEAWDVSMWPCAPRPRPHAWCRQEPHLFSLGLPRATRRCLSTHDRHRRHSARPSPRTATVHAYAYAYT